MLRRFRTPHAIHFAITMINRRLNASVRRRSCVDFTARQIDVLQNSSTKIDCLFPFKRIDLIERTAFPAVWPLSCGTLTGTDTFEQQPEAKRDLNIIQGDTSPPSKAAPLNSSAPPARGRLEPGCSNLFGESDDSERLFDRFE